MAFPGFDSPAYGTVQGSLPWNAGGSGAPAFGSSEPAAIASSYQQAYNSALAMNQANYNNILAGYQQSIATHSSAQQAIQAGYSQLYNQVLAQVGNIYSGQSDTINRDAARSLASNSQQLINRGLGNTTIQQSVNRGIEADRTYQQSLLTGQRARTTADYMSQLGLAGLSNQSRGLAESTGLVGRQLDWMNSVNARYPDAGLYASLAQTAAATKAAEQHPLSYGGGAFGGPANPGPKLGYVPGGGPYYGSGGGYGSPDTGGGGSWLMGQYGMGTSAGAGDTFAGYGGDTGVMTGWDQPTPSDPWAAGEAKGYGGYGGYDNSQYSENYGSGLYDTASYG